MLTTRGAHRSAAEVPGLALRALVFALGVVFAAPSLAQEVCARLEAELASTERGGGARGGRRDRQRVEQAYHRQRYEYDRLVSMGRQYGCGGGFFTFGERHPSCGRIDAQLDRAETALRQLKAQLAQADAGPDEEDRREAIEVAMRRYGCRRGAEPDGRGLFARLFGVPRIEPRREAPEIEQRDREDDDDGDRRFSGSYRTLCVRTCDGYYWPINFSSTARNFATETKVCEASCPGQPVQLYVHRNPGEWSESAVSLEGKPYSESPNAFAYRESYKPECGCQKPAVSVAAAPEVPATPIPASARRAGGAKIVTPPAKADAKPAESAAAPAASTPAPPPSAPGPVANSSVRVVGPTFLPAR